MFRSKKTIFKCFLIASCSQVATASVSQNLSLDEAALWPKSKFMSYQQNQFAVNDPAGDLILARLLSHFPFDVIKIKMGSLKIAVPQQEMLSYEASPACLSQNILDQTCREAGYISRTEIENPEPFVEGTETPLKQADLLKAFVRVIQEEKLNSNINPSISEAPKWSDEFISKYTNKYSFSGPSNPEDYGYITDLFDKPLVALFFGSTSKFMITGKEEQLTRWLVSQPLRSVTLIDLFRKAYLMHEGDLHHAMLSAENILSRRWRHASREDLQMTRRLKPFTNWKNNNVNDNFGSWYHFWGVAYYGLIRGKEKAVWAANVEHKGSVFLGSDDFEMQENFVNLHGAILGGELREIILNETWKTMQTAADYVQESSYRHYQIVYSAQENGE